MYRRCIANDSPGKFSKGRSPNAHCIYAFEIDAGNLWRYFQARQTRPRSLHPLCGHEAKEGVVGFVCFGWGVVACVGYVTCCTHSYSSAFYLRVLVFFCYLFLPYSFCLISGRLFRLYVCLYIVCELSGRRLPGIRPLTTACLYV